MAESSQAPRLGGASFRGHSTPSGISWLPTRHSSSTQRTPKRGLSARPSPTSGIVPPREVRFCFSYQASLLPSMGGGFCQTYS